MSYNETVLTLWRTLTLVAAALFIMLGLFALALVSDEGYAALLWTLFFLFLSAVSIAGFKRLRHRQEALGRPVRPGAFGAIAIVIITVALYGFLIAILLPGIIHPAAHQKRTMANMRSIGTALEAYAVDHVFYPETRLVNELGPLLSPLYIRELPIKDAWGNAFVYLAWKEAETSTGMDAYAIASAGKDGKWEHRDLRNYKTDQTNDMSRDIVWRSGEFIQWPEGLQR